MSIDANTSIETLRRATVVSQDGSKIGKVAEVYLGDHSEQPEWVTVKTGLFGTSETFVPLADASVHGDELRVPYGKDKVKDAPRTDADGQISEAEEDRLFTYFGITGQGQGRDEDSRDRTSTSGPTDRSGTDGREDPRDDAALAGAGVAGVAGRGGDEDVYDVDTDSTDRADSTGRTGATDRASTSDTSDAAGRHRAVDTRRDRTGETGIEGSDVSGPTTDESMTRSEERLQAGTQRRESGRARLRKHVVTETQTAQVGTSREELTIEREPITEANRGAATAGSELSEEEHEVVLHEEVPVVSTTVEAVERVRLGAETQHETQDVSADVRKEQINLDTDVDPALQGKDKY